MTPGKPTIPSPGEVPEIDWPEVHARFMQKPDFALQVQTACAFDWAGLPVEDTGTTLSTAPLVGEVMKRFPERFDNASGISLKWESLEQRDINANRLLGGLWHPFKYVSQAIENIEKRWEWSKGHIVVLPPPKLLGGRIMLKQEDGFVHGMVGALPPIECIGILRSTGLKPHDYASSLVVLWHQTGFGIDATINDQVRQLDWASLAFSWSP